MYLGLDLGTFGLKGFLIPNKLRLVGSAYASYVIENFATEWSQQNSDYWIKAFKGVAFALKENLNALKKTGAKIEKLYTLGGGVQSDLWLKTIENVLNLTLLLPRKHELGAALGAARLALSASEGPPTEQIMTQRGTGKVIEPNSSLVGIYDDAFQVFRKVYPSIKELV